MHTTTGCCCFELILHSDLTVTGTSRFVQINNCVSNGQDRTLTASLLSPGKSLKSGLFNSCLHSLHLAGGYDERNTKAILVSSMDHEQIP